MTGLQGHFGGLTDQHRPFYRGFKRLLVSFRMLSTGSWSAGLEPVPGLCACLTPN